MRHGFDEASGNQMPERGGERWRFETVQRALEVSALDWTVRPTRKGGEHAAMVRLSKGSDDAGAQDGRVACARIALGRLRPCRERSR
jgi:hypothetical protein